MNQDLLFLSLYDKNTHIQFEASLISLYVNIYHPKKVYLFGNKEHFLKVRKYLPPAQYHHLESKFASSTFICLSYFFRTLFLKNTYRIELTGFFSTPFYFLCGIFQKEILLHVPWWHDTRFHRIIFGFLNFQIVTLFRFNNLRLLVLGEWIFNSYKKTKLLLFFQKKLLFWINHPYTLPILDVPINVNKFWKITLGFLWNLNARHKKILFSPYYQKLSVNKNISIIWNLDVFLTEEEYKHVLLSSDYVIIPYLQNYSFVCSWVLVECICFLKPIICVRSPISEYFFEKYWDLGFQVSNFEEMLSLIERLPMPSDKNYLIFLNNLKKARTFLTNIDLLSKNYMQNSVNYFPKVLSK